MRIRERGVAASLTKDSSLSASEATATHQHWYAFLLSPLWICLLLALVLRIWLVVHTQGFIDGDEALVGIQAQHILRGEFPVYYYGQPYMGSLEAYFIALIFALVGPSTWAMRTEPILLSLVLVWLTWRLAGALADAAKLPAPARNWFMTIAALFAALPPLYDMVVELRTWGGHIETYLIALWLLLSALRLTQRWQTASRRELAARWAGIGFLVGLGLWVYPLIVSAVLTAALWIAGFCIIRIIAIFKARRGTEAPQRSIASILHPLILAVVALPASLIGFAPALFWGASHQWANITYLLSPSNNSSRSLQLQTLYPSRLSLLLGTTKFYAECVAPHILGGALPNGSITKSILQAGIAILFALAATGLVVIAVFRHHPLLQRIQQLAALPVLFGATTAVIFCVSGISAAGLLDPCTRDEVGRYAAPLLLAVPFFFATIFTAIYLYVQERQEHQAQSREQSGSSAPIASRQLGAKRVSFVLAACLVLYTGTQAFATIRADSSYTFQSFACAYAPLHNEPIIAYMQQQHIQYAWATMWIGNNIVFKTGGSILVADPRIITVAAANHIPANTAAVAHASRPSVLAFVLHNDTHPALLTGLDAEGVTYHLARFPAEQGLDVLVVTPDRTLSPFDANSLGSWFYGC